MTRGSGFNLSSWAVEHQPLVRYLMVVLLLGGLFAFDRLGQDEDPPFTFRTMVVRAYWPGATATQMAEQVTDKLEKKLQETPGLEKLRSYSKPGETLIFVQLNESMRGHDVVDAWYQVRKKVGDIRATLPPNVQGPLFNDEFGDVYGVMFAFSSDGFTYRELKDHVEAVRQQLLRVPNVAKVDLFGAQDEKIFVEISHKKLAQIGLDIPQLAAQISAQNAVEGAGVLVLPTDNLQVRVSGEFRSVDELRQLPIRANGLSYKLADIATLSRAYTDPPRDKMRAGRGGAEGREVIGLGVSMVKGGDIIQLGKDLAAVGHRLETSLPVGIDMVKVADQPRAVATSVNDFLRVLAEALIVVLGVSFLSLGLHTKPLRVDPGPGLVVLATIPLVLAITFLAMWLLGINLHKISLGALIVALGLLVDDAIIAVEMMVRKLEEGASKTVAVTSMYETTAMPMLTGTLITAAGFLPIAIAKSSAGEYTMSIFQVTALALVISWFVAVLFVPLLGVWLLKVKPHSGAHDAAELFATPFYSRFRALVELVCRMAQDRHRDHDRGAGAWHWRLPLHRAAVLPRFEPARARGRPVAAGGFEPAGDRGGNAAVRALAGAAAGARLVRQLRGDRCAALLPAARPAVQQHQPGGNRGDAEGSRKPGPAAGEDDRAVPDRPAEPSRPGEAAAQRTTGVLPGAVPRAGTGRAHRAAGR